MNEMSRSRFDRQIIKFKFSIGHDRLTKKITFKFTSSASRQEKQGE